MMSGVVQAKRVVVAAAAVVLVLGVWAVTKPAEAATDRWVASWTSMPQLTETANMPPAPYTNGSLVMADTTLRQTIRVTLGGSRVRLHLNNVFGGAVLPITAASVALPVNGRAGVSGIQAGSARSVTFAGKASVTVAAGSEAVSDPLDFTVASGTNLTVTLYLAAGQASSRITSHPGSRTTSYLVRGNHLTDTTLSGATATDHWYFLSGLDVTAAEPTGTVVVLGDSLTDGRGSTTNGNDRWPDKLFDRLRTTGVANQAAGGNAVLSGGLGPTALSRFDRDVLGTPGVRWLIVFEGVNDLGPNGSTQTADRLIAAYQQFIAKAHAAGIRVYGATITPFAGNAYDDAAGTHEAARQRVNSWIRTSGAYDAVLDFDQVVRDPGNPRRLRSAYDTGDGLHMNPAGYAALAAAVPTSLFSTPAPSTPAPSTPAPSTSAPSTPRPSTSVSSARPSTPAGSSAAPTPGPGSACVASYSVSSSWDGGFTASVTVTAGSAGTQGWKVALTMPAGTAVSAGWGAAFTGTSGTVTATSLGYNSVLGAGQSVTFGLQGTGSGAGVTAVCTAS